MLRRSIQASPNMFLTNTHYASGPQSWSWRGQGALAFVVTQHLNVQLKSLTHSVNSPDLVSWV